MGAGKELAKLASYPSLVCGLLIFNRILEKAVGLNLALQAHNKGDFALAEKHYKKALKVKTLKAILFQNYGALLRSQERDETAGLIYDQGLTIFPRHAGILANRANLLRPSHPARALADNLAALRSLLAKGDSKSIKQAQCIVNTAVGQLRDLKLYQWALALATESLLWATAEPGLLLQLLLIVDELESQQLALGSDASFNSCTDVDYLEELYDLIESRIADAEPLLQAEIRLGLAGHKLSKVDVDKAIANYEYAMSILQYDSTEDLDQQKKKQKLVDINSWNFGCSLLKHQELERGWRLYEYGLRTPAQGRQRWQRALYKPFTASDLPLWRGETLKGKHLLLLEEQAIGDTMMFLSLVPCLVMESDSIDIVLGRRLLSIYKRSFEALGLGDSIKILHSKNVKDGDVSPSNFDFQSPIGSICQYRFTNVKSYARCSPVLQPKTSRVEQLRNEYCSSGSKVDILVGISWRGGAKGARIKQKSLSPDAFSKLLKPLPGVRFISLQYGKVESIILDWQRQGLDVLHDNRVDPLKQMDLWLAQVAACDAVVSVANTTIHGAGGLDIPTMCLLSIHSDWRWFDDPVVTRSYWYHSVGIARESRQFGWSDAFKTTRRWLEEGCPAPKGEISTPICT